MLFPHGKCGRNCRINELLRPVLFPAERSSEEEAHSPAHGKYAVLPGQGRGAGFCDVGRIHQRICFFGQSSQAFQPEPHLCNVTHFSALFLQGWFPPRLHSCDGCEQCHNIRLISKESCGGTTVRRAVVLSVKAFVASSDRDPTSTGLSLKGESINLCNVRVHE